MKKPAVRSVALDAAKAIHGEKRQAYGPVYESFQRVADLANIMLAPEHKFYADDAARFMLCVKLAREQFSHSRDNLVDICGYADLLQQLHEHEDRTE
jgi:hypothetical protein